MEVYLIRHGIAASPDRYSEDETRPLIEKGIIKTTKVAQKLLQADLKFDLILTSPLTRTIQTAAILRQAGLAQTIENFDPLKPDGNIQQWLMWLQSWQTKNPNSKLALVGHQPNLGNWAEMLVWGAIQGHLLVKKAGVVGIKLPEVGSPISRSTLFLLTSPKWSC